MPQSDTFIIQATPTNSLWTLSDAWIAPGGKWCHLEFSNTRQANSNLWFGGSNVEFNTSSGTPLSSTIESVQYENRNTETVVYITCKLSRIVQRDEIITVLQGIYATNGSQFASISTNTVIRNYCNCDSDGDAHYPLRVGSTPNTRKTDPSTVTLGKLFSVRAEDTNESQINGGQWIGTSRLVTETGSMTLIPSSSFFDNRPVVRLSDGFLGSIPNYYTNPINRNHMLYIVVFRPVNTRARFNLAHTDIIGDVPVIPITPTPVPSILQMAPPAGEGFGPEGDPVSYNSRNYWSVMHDFGESEQYLNVDSTQITTKKMGNLGGRVCVAAVRWNGTRTTLFTYGGNSIGKVDIPNPANIPNLPLGFADGSQYDFFGVRIQSGSADVAEIHCFEVSFAGDTYFTDNEIAEYLSFLDNKYQISAKKIYVHPNSGSDSNSGVLISPYATLSRSLQDVAFGSGDQIVFRAGEETTGITGPLVLECLGNTSATLGYSPDYPFLLGYYGDRDDGRVVHTFDPSTPAFVAIQPSFANVAIDGHSFRCPERNPLDSGFVGHEYVRQFVETNSDRGYGILYNGSFDSFVYKPNSVHITDCDISESLRHAIAFRANSPNILPTHTKYSSIRRTQISNCFNVSGVSNADHEMVPGKYGVAGVYCEGICGIHAEDMIFHRCGWNPDVTIVGVSGAIVHSITPLANESLFISSGINAAISQEYDPWSQSTNENKDYQRIKIVDINGTPQTDDLYLIVKYWNGNTLAIKEPASNIGLDVNDVVDFYLVDGAPRTGGNADIVINGVNTDNSSVVSNNCFGPFSLIGNIHLESSGHAILSNSSYLMYDGIVEDTFFGAVISPGYTTIKGCLFGASVGVHDEIRKSPETSYAFGTHRVGSVVGAHRYANRHANAVYFPAFSGSIYSRITGNIFHYPDETFLQGSKDFTSNQSAYGQYYPTCYVFVDQRSFPNSVRSEINFNTFYTLPGSVFIFGGNLAQDNISLSRNIFDLQTDFTPSDRGEIFYTLQHPFTRNFSSLNAFQRGEYNSYKITNRNEADNIPTIYLEVRDGVFDVPSNPNSSSNFNWNFTQWKANSGDTGTWTEVQYATSAGSLSSYASISMGLPESSQLHFVTTAISVHHADGWSSAYSAEMILESHIRPSFLPTNLNRSSFGNNYIGAVEFISSAISFVPYWTKVGVRHGYT